MFLVPQLLTLYPLLMRALGMGISEGQIWYKYFKYLSNLFAPCMPIRVYEAEFFFLLLSHAGKLDRVVGTKDKIIS